MQVDLKDQGCLLLCSPSLKTSEVHPFFVAKVNYTISFVYVLAWSQLLRFLQSYKRSQYQSYEESTFASSFIWRDALDEPNNGRSEHLFFSQGFTINIYGLKIELDLSTYLFYLFIFRRFKCTTLIIKELLLSLLHFFFTNIAIFIKPWLNIQIL